jgi:hypothetical protein
MLTSRTEHLESPGLDVVGNDTGPSMDDNVHVLLQKLGFSPHKIAELLDELPPLRTADVLVDFYFSTMYVWSYYVLRTFLSSSSRVAIGRGILSLKGISEVATRPSMLTSRTTQV